MRIVCALCSILSWLALAASSAHAIDVGDVFWLSSSGAGLTVTGTVQAQPGVVRVDYKILRENASEFCQRYRQYARLTPQHEKCVADIIGNSPQRTALVNCNTRVIVLSSGAFAKSDDHFWRSRTDPNSFVLGDELFSRSCAQPVGSSWAAPPSSADVRMGPSFDCGTKAVATQPLAQMICVSPELSLWELAYVIAYQALREAETPAGKKAMVDEANALVVDMNAACGIPTSGRIQEPPTAGEVTCIRGKFQAARATLIGRSAGVAREEATLEPRETVAIQRGLQSKGHLPITATLDGVFGPMTRTAITSWQRDNGQSETGFGSRAMLAQLGGTPSPQTAASVPAPARPTASTSGTSQTTSLSVDRSGKSAAVRLALSDGTELRPQDIFEKAGKAVYVVKSDTSLGSAVAVSDRELLTNCHVVGNNASVTLEREGARFPAAVVSANPDADRCVLRATGIAEPLPSWARVRPYADVKVGERVFTIGAPRGLELSLAEGIVSSKRVTDDGRLIQTSAPISRGSSGGGLFDAQGNLVGITTFMVKDAQNINFAIAAEEYAK